MQGSWTISWHIVFSFFHFFSESLRYETDFAGVIFRCLAFAVKTEIGQFADYDGDSHPAHKQLLDPNNYTSIETDLTWLGVAALQDPPRPEVGQAIKDCKTAGIEVLLTPSSPPLFSWSDIETPWIFCPKSRDCVSFFIVTLMQRSSIISIQRSTTDMSFVNHSLKSAHELPY